MKKIRLAAVAAASLLTPALVASSAGAEEAPGDGPPLTAPTYTITFTNDTDGQYFTPPNIATHERGVRVFQQNRAASPGVQAVAENGGVPTLAAELDGALDSVGLGRSTVIDGPAGPIGPGDSRSITFTTEFSQISLVSMIICSNDGFAGADTVQLPRNDGQTKRTRLRAYDAGTEINTELRGDLVGAPFCGEGEGTGESNPDLAENGVIRPHRTIQGIGDLGPAFDWTGRVATLEITRHDPAPSYDIWVENLTDGQYLTPPNVAIHDRSVRVFSRGQAASPGVQAVAENGGVPILAAELDAAIDQQGLGASTVGDGPAGPISPGDSRHFTLTSDGDRLSLVSMVVCTNDGFAGLNSARLNLAPGQSKTFLVRALDAGTEINTELRADLVGAPFCGEGEGSGASDPDLAENGVITNHRTLRGVGDLADSLDWKGPVLSITVTRQG